MLVIVLENAPARLQGYLKRLFLEVHAGVYVGNYSRRVRDRTWDIIKKEIGKGDAVICWCVPNDAGFDFDTFGPNRRIPIELDGLKLCSMTPIVKKSKSEKPW